jgi:hypothetical protein
MSRSLNLSTIGLMVVASLVIMSLVFAPVSVRGVNPSISSVGADESSILPQTGAQSQSTNASVTINENETTQDKVALASVTLPHPGYIVAYEKTQPSFNLTNESIIGRTVYVRSGTFQNVVVSINESITNNTTIVVAVHNETNGNEDFDYINQSGPDAAYESRSGEPIVDIVRLGSESTNQSSKANQSINHTRLPKQITLNAGYASDGQNSTYSITVSGEIEGTNLSSNDTVESEKRIVDSVGPQQSDVIYYSGYITEFNSSDAVTATIADHEIPTEVLGANRITFIRRNNSSPSASIEYQFSVSEVVSPGVTATNDTWFDDNTIMGKLTPNDSTDTYYYTGGITQSSITHSARIIINGQQVGVNPENNSSNNQPASKSPQNKSNIGFRLSNITVNKQKLEVGSELIVNATITNTKQGRLKTIFGLGTAGTVTTSKTVTLYPKGSQRISFQYTYDSPGHYAVKIAVLNESGYVVATSKTTKMVDVVPEGAKTPTPTPTPNQQSSGSGAGFGIIIGMAAAVILVGILLIRR